jgi:uncharacterized glyoxalase superfamily protein PhnB
VTEPLQRNSLTSSLSYKDPRAAIDWLEKAFGFERAFVVTDDKGEVGHAELRFDDSLLMLGGEWTDNVRSPLSLGGKTTQSVHVHLRSDIDAHCARARAAGAVIVQEPQEQFYGDRTYRALDPEGHMWTFGQTVRQLSVAEMEKASGLKFEMPQ